MRAGRLDRRITIKQIAEARSATGGIVETASTFLNELPAEVRPVRGKEFFSGDTKLAEVDTVFKVRYDPTNTISPKMYIEYDSKEYDIYSIVELGRNEGTEIYAKARVT